MGIMLQRTISSTPKKFFLISAIAVSLVACSSGTESTNTSTDSATPSISSASSSSPPPTVSPASVAIPGVNNVKEIKFKTAPTAANGLFNNIKDGSSGPKIKVSKATPFKVDGWAILSAEGRPADMVIITYGDNNSLVAVTPVNLERVDVAKTLKNPAYKNSGWSTTINPSTLPSGNVVLQGWAYSSARKEAIQFNNSHQVVVPE